MSSGSTVTVVIPAHNAAAHLGAALASVAAQSVPPAAVVVVDDCSTDGTAELAQRWSAVLPLTLVRLERNQGPGAARRRGIDATDTELIALLDSDDYWLPDHLEELLRVYARTGGLVTSRSLRWFPGEGVSASDSARSFPVPPPAEQREAILRDNFVFVGALFARDDYERCGGFGDLRRSEDWDLWIRMVLSGVLVSVTHRPTVLYRQHPTSLSAGDAINEADIDLLQQLQATVCDADRIVVERSLRRRQARRELLAGYRHAAGGHALAARRSFLSAAWADRDPSGGLRRGASGVTAKAMMAAAAPGLAVRLRRGDLDRNRLVARLR